MAETPSPHGALADLLRAVGPFVPGIAGAVLGMVFGEGLTVRGKVTSLVAGLAAAIWLGPAFVHLAGAVWPGTMPNEIAPAVLFLTGVFGMVVLSGLAVALAKYSKDPFGLVRIQAGPVTIGGEQPK